jgi:signal peptidase I
MSEPLPVIEAEEKAPSPPPRPAHHAGLSESIQSLLVTIILALFGTCFIVQAFKIPSQSMEPTLLIGDHLLVNKFIFGGRGAWYEKLLPYRAIRRGDIIVFKFPYQDHTHYVKRVIGTPGDHVKIVNQRVFVNGQALVEPYVVHEPGAGDLFGDNFPTPSRYYYQANVLPEWAAQMPSYVKGGELVVPANHYFVMGDNRDRSWDSRYWGFVDRDAIMGRPVVIYWSVNASAFDITERSGFFGRLIALGDTILHLPINTRWKRMFRLVH